MNNFIKKQKLFQTSSSLQTNEEEEVDEVEISSKIICSICHLENENDCFIYPALIYKNSLQSYIKWRFRKCQTGSEFVDDLIVFIFACILFIQNASIRMNSIALLIVALVTLLFRLFLEYSTKKQNLTKKCFYNRETF